jgi:hypothetical protein
MRKNPVPWPPFSPEENTDHRPPDSGLAHEDSDTQIQVDRYLHLADDFLSTDEVEEDESEKAA